MEITRFYWVQNVDFTAFLILKEIKKIKVVVLVLSSDILEKFDISGFFFYYKKNIPRSARGITKLYTIIAMLYHRICQYSKRQTIKKQMLDRLLPHLPS